MKIGILVDSSTGLEPSKLTNTNIEVIPLHIIINSENDILDVKEQREKNKIYEQIQNGVNVTTSQASPGELIVKYEEMLMKYDHIIHLPIPSNLSGMAQTAVMVSKDEEFLGKVTVVNHFLAANLLGRLVFQLNEMTKNENLTIEQYLEKIDDWSKKSVIYLIPSDLKKLAKGGRAQSLLLSVLKLLKQKIAIQWGEKPKKVAMGRTIASIIDKLLDNINTNFSKEIKLIFVHTEIISNKFLTQIKEKLELIKIDYDDEIIPTPFPCHSGLDTIGFLIYEKSLQNKND
ncbi:fatty acid-binding protein DegV [Spiroplasma gladiatoris]|uniref:Fatty acid-binding protein DegV n=1 Tax=Spiroplasma gladiatoris TaxID=2143 RepID=A0A4P7AIS1_9MOLU|nr:DegV family protein [Spiroplasma gladiatoris]QBQ08081.1 fatty acid-binding protein DegV [Spiroplasma gladiatoris]